MTRLDIGERAAIRLAESLRADLILLDERAGRRVAAERGLKVTGLLGLLDLAADLGLVELGQVLDELRATGFRASQALLKQLGGKARR